MSWHPFRVLGGLAHITLVWVDLPGHRGLTDGLTTIWLDRFLLRGERRTALTHELIHVERGDTAACCASDELRVKKETARRCIELGDLVDVMCWTTDWAEAAEELNVDVPTLRLRLEHLHPAERARVRAQVAARLGVS